MTWLPIGVYRTFPLPILPILPPTKKRNRVKAITSPVKPVIVEKVEPSEKFEVPHILIPN